MSLQRCINRVEALHRKLKPAPAIIDCTPAYNELIAMLEAQMRNDGMTEEEIHKPVEWNEEQLATIEALDAFLEESVRYIEEECNIKLVCSE